MDVISDGQFKIHQGPTYYGPKLFEKNPQEEIILPAYSRVE